ncbi:MAG TPA: glucose 1-dehydrogenase [Sphingomonadaceae bacterium]|jgi:NAD(P)-dependent dehydrogenase (short-subunit alcohol dehydrogenase family)|nr:glucose 1-dehydrogenase [Sphingomonadaceae bacterium]
MTDLKDRRIIVTGAAGAIGYATAEVLARDGAALLLVDIAGDRLAERTEALRGTGARVEAVVADCSKDEDVRRYVEAALAHFGRIDGFFNNAGTEGKIAPTPEYEVEEFDRIIAINLRSMFLGLRRVLPVMLEQGKGAIVNTGSIASERGLAGACAYNASKHGILGLTRTAATEVGNKGVRINCVLPGVIETPLLNAMLEQMFDGDVAAGKAVLGRVASLDRCGKPAEIGEAVAFLLSDAASFVNGAAWAVDGGALATIRN